MPATHITKRTMKNIRVINLLLAIGIGLTATAAGALTPAADVQTNADKAGGGYLFTYFEGTGPSHLQEHLRFAVSDDGFNWKALNHNSPIVNSDTISITGGTRDHHILRGHDGKTFYIVATDMNTLRDGWGSNPGIVMMKSNDLVNWSHSIVNLPADYARKFKDAFWVWAPQTLYNPETGKYMVYFTVRRQDSSKGFTTYYAYANKDFTGFEGEPKVLFRTENGAIDNDIVQGPDGKWYMFYKGNEGIGRNNGIQYAVSRHPTGPWKEMPGFVDAYAGKTPVEGSGIYRLSDTGEYVLMYDLYTSGRYEYQTSRDLKTFSKEPKAFTKDFFPRHGTVMAITADERKRLDDKWGDNARYSFRYEGNPLIRHKHTADPATMVVGDTLWLFTGYDEPGNKEGYHMPNWCAFATTDMKNWTEYPVPIYADDFKWNKAHVSFAGHPVEGPDGKYYFYSSTNSCGIGVAQSDRPEGPYKDILGRPLLTTKDCKGTTHGWACIDPAVFIDDDGQPYIFWGNQKCYYARLNRNMKEIDGEIHRVKGLKDFTEAPYIHKANGKYYLTYAAQWPEKIAYAMADSITGPWEYMGIISEIAGNSNTTHPAIVNFKGRDWFFSHIGGLGGGSGSRSVIIEPLYYNSDGTIRPIPATAAGASTEYSALDNKHNPILPEFHADPEILYSHKTGKYYIYSTTDGTPGWGGHYFSVFSSGNLADWTNEGIVLDLKGPQVPWATGNAWAPAVIERRYADGSYKYFLYYSGHSAELGRKAIGVAVADSPAGPFYDCGRPIVTDSPAGKGQQIDVDVFHDPASGKYFLYWGNGYMAGAELNDDMVSLKEGTTRVMTPEGGTLQDYAYREAPYVFYRDGRYYFLWSVDDTGSKNYHIAYGTSDSPSGTIKVASNPVILVQNPEKEIYGTGHCAVINLPGSDEWRIVYHRINRHYLNDGPGIHRQVCIDRMDFNPDGTIMPVHPTR